MLNQENMIDWPIFLKNLNIELFRSSMYFLSTDLYFKKRFFKLHLKNPKYTNENQNLKCLLQKKWKIKLKYIHTMAELIGWVTILHEEKAKNLQYPNSRRKSILRMSSYQNWCAKPKIKVNFALDKLRNKQKKSKHFISCASEMLEAITWW